MVHLNVYECRPTDDDLRVWRHPSNDKDIAVAIDREHDSITTDTQATPAIAVPTNEVGKRVLEDKTGYEPATVPWRKYLGVYSNMVQYGIVHHLVMNHDFEPLQVDQDDAKNNRVYEVYKTKPIFEPVDGLEIRPGLKVRSRFWDFPDQGPTVGIIFTYTTKNYFTDPLNELFDGTTSQDYWLEMNCPSDCPHEECTFYWQDGLIGHFEGFAGTGEECRYDDIDSDQFISLSPAAPGVTQNPPVERVVIEPSYANIRQWATDKYGSGKSGIIESISKERLDAPTHMSYGRVNEREAKFEQDRLEEMVSSIAKDVELPTGQTVTISDEPIQLVT